MDESEHLSPLRAISQVITVFWMQALLVFKARFFGAHLSGAGFISWGAQGSNPLLLREKLWVLSSLLIVGHCNRDGFHGKIVSQTLLPTLMSDFLHSSNAQESLRQLLGFFQRKLFCITCKFGLFMGGGEPRILLYHHLEPEL